MNYEVKSISPMSVLINSARIFLIVGFIIGLISFFIVPNPNIRITAFWQKTLATLLFTVVYGIVVTLILTGISWLYNFWAKKHKGISIRLEQE